MTITKTSGLTGKVHTREIPGITEEQLINWEKGFESIQTAFPHLSADDREFIMTGITPEEWEQIFKEEE